MRPATLHRSQSTYRTQDTVVTPWPGSDRAGAAPSQVFTHLPVQPGCLGLITLTPTAAVWLDHLGERQRLEDLTGLPVRSTPGLPDEPKPHPKSEVSWGAPLTARSVAKLALGIADNQALTSCANASPPFP